MSVLVNYHKLPDESQPLTISTNALITKPCPFCGGKGILKKTDQDEQYAFCICCGTQRTWKRTPGNLVRSELRADLARTYRGGSLLERRIGTWCSWGVVLLSWIGLFLVLALMFRANGCNRSSGARTPADDGARCSVLNGETAQGHGSRFPREFAAPRAAAESQVKLFAREEECEIAKPNHERSEPVERHSLVGRS